MNYLKILGDIVGTYHYFLDDYYVSILSYLLGVVGFSSFFIGLYCLVVVFFTNNKDTQRYRWHRSVLIWCVVILFVIFALYAIIQTPVYSGVWG